MGQDAMSSQRMSDSLLHGTFDSLEKRLEIYMQGRVYPMEIATTFNFVLYDEFSKLRDDTFDHDYLCELEETGAGIKVPRRSLKPVFVGEYFVDPNKPEQTRVYCHQGTEACSPIPTKRGVIGRAVRTGEDQFIPDVTKDPLHIGCDPNMEGTEVVLISWAEPYSSGDYKGARVPLGVLDLDFNIKAAITSEEVSRLRSIWDAYGKLIFPGEPEFEPKEDLFVLREKTDS